MNVIVTQNRKTLIENSSVLSLMDFLSTKNIAFKKLWNFKDISF
jgi:hypothetical protein